MRFYGALNPRAKTSEYKTVDFSIIPSLMSDANTQKLIAKTY